METRCPILRSAAPFDIVSLSFIFDDDECMLELSSCFHVHPEVRLKGIRYLHSLRYIEKCPPTPYGPVKRREHMISRWHKFHEVFADDVFVFMNRDRHILEYHSLILKLLTEAMIDDLTIILSPYSSEDFSFCLRNAETIECFFYGIRDIVP